MYRTLMAIVSVLHYVVGRLQEHAYAAEDKAVRGVCDKARKAIAAAKARVQRAELEVARAASAYEDEGERQDAKLEDLYDRHGYTL